MRDYIDVLVEEANVVLPKEEMEEYKTKLEDLFTRRLGLEMAKLLDEKGLVEYDKLLNEKSKAKEIESFFSSRVDNFEEKVKEILENFRKDYLSSFEKAE